MADELTSLRAFLADIVRRRSALAWRRGWTTGALSAALVLATTRLAVALAAPTGAAFALLVALGAVVAALALTVALRAVRGSSTDRQLARLVEERFGGLDDVVVSAVDYASRADHAPAMADRLAASALGAVSPEGADRIVRPGDLTYAGRTALGAAAALIVAVAFFLGPAADAVRVAAAYVVPSRFQISVEPGDVRVRAGAVVTIVVRVLGGVAPLTPTFLAGEGTDATPVAMTARDGGAFEIVVPDVSATFTYRVRAGGLRSADYTVTVVHPPTVERIDLDYAYPPALELEPRREEDGGDIYAPEGTIVRLTVTADRAVKASAIVLADGTRVPLGVDGRLASGGLTVRADGSYRVALVEDDGVETADDTEYFIRTLLDRPPDVRVVRPAGDRQVTPLEEVLIEARADDDFGVRSFELVLQKPGEAEVIVPFPGPRDGLTVNGRHLLFLEDLEVAPGDFVTYYVRARDVGRGKPSSESRSDIYFLEVKAFNDEFVAAQSQAMAAGAQAQGVQDLAAAQKEIVVATWKLDSRGRRASRAGSAQDLRTLATAQRALEQRAAKEAGNQLQAAGGGPPRRRRGPATVNEVTDDPMGLAIEAMRRAAAALEQLQPSAALPHEKEALNQLLRAEADVQRRQVARQQGGGGGGGNRNTPDLSSLFDQELRKQQQTNYETPASSETRQDERQEDDPLAKLRELARRQEALSREQQDLARNQAALEAEALKRRLERLSRDQEELRRQLEQLARELPERRDASGERRESSQPSQQSQAQPGPPGPPGPPGKPGKPGQAGQRAGGGPSSGSPQASEQQAMREAADDMRQATSGLQQQDPGRASESAGRALERMRRAEEALRGSTADDLQRRLGDLQLEARQLAETERRLASEMQRMGAGGESSSRGRQMASEQERLAARTERLGQQLRDLSRQARGTDGRAALDQAGRELESGKVAERMREAARTLKDAARTLPAGPSASAESTRPGMPGAKPGTPAGTQPGATTAAASSAAAIGAEVARTLDRVAERLDAGRAGDPSAARRLSDTLSQAGQLREQIEGVERSLEQLNARGENARGGRDQNGQPRQRQNGQSGARGENAAANAAANAEVARLQRQVAEQMREARAQVENMGRAAPDMQGPSTPEDWQPSVSAPGTEAFKQDFARWESLKQNLLVALEKVERSMSDELRQQETKDRLSAGASDAVPDDYRKLVEKYYRSLATPRRPER